MFLGKKEAPEQGKVGEAPANIGTCLVKACFQRTIMDQPLQFAYRYLLYSAALRTRPLRWQPYRWQWLNVFFWPRYIRDVRECGELAEWLHNLADYSCRDFQGFDEQRFWKEYEFHRKQYPEFWVHRATFENALELAKTGEWPSIEAQVIRNVKFK